MRADGVGPGPAGEVVLDFPALEQALRGAVARSAATVHVVGRPGGLLRLHGSRVVDAWTVGTPLGVPSPGRRARADATSRQPARFVAIADIVYAIASGAVHAVWEEPGPPTEPDGIDLERLLRETRRRLAAVRDRKGPTLLADTLVTARSAGGPDPRLLSVQERTVVGLIGGGVIAVRDIAFLVDRGLFAVTLDVGRLIEVGLVEVAPRPAPPAPAPAPAPPAQGPPVPAAAAPPSAERAPTGGVLGMFSRRRRQLRTDASEAVAAPLARRVPGQSGVTRPVDERGAAT